MLSLPVAVILSAVVLVISVGAGVFLARWSLPALILGTSSVRADLRRAPHLIIWALLAGCLWAVANTLTVFAIRDVGLMATETITEDLRIEEEIDREVVDMIKSMKREIPPGSAERSAQQ